MVQVMAWCHGAPSHYLNNGDRIRHNSPNFLVPWSINNLSSSEDNLSSTEDMTNLDIAHPLSSEDLSEWPLTFQQGHDLSWSQQQEALCLSKSSYFGNNIPRRSIIWSLISVIQIMQSIIAITQIIQSVITSIQNMQDI